MRRPIVPASTDIETKLYIIGSEDGLPVDSVTSATPGLQLFYRKPGADRVELEAINDLSALTDPHNDEGLLLIGAGKYRLDLPDAASPAADGDVIDIFGTATDMIIHGDDLVGRTPPVTQAQLLAALAALNDISPAEVKAEADQALNDVGLTSAVTARIDMNISDVAAAVWAAFDSALANFIADHVLRRGAAAARASADGDPVTWRSLLGVVSTFVNRRRSNEATGKIEFYEEDDATIFQTVTASTDPDAEPTTEMVPD